MNEQPKFSKIFWPCFWAHGAWILVATGFYAIALAFVIAAGK